MQLQSWMKQLTDDLNEATDSTPARIVDCPITDIGLYKVLPEGKTEAIRSYGVCTHCKKEVHVSALSRYHPTYFAEWPIVHTGEAVWCKVCYDLPLDEPPVDDSVGTF